MKNEGRGIDSDTDFKRVNVSVTETTDKTRLLIKRVEPTELYADTNTLLYSEELKHIDGYVNLHMHLYRPEEDLSFPKVKNIWVLEDTRNEQYINDTIGYKRTGHFKPVRYNPEINEYSLFKTWRFFATTDPECLRGGESDMMRFLSQRGAHEYIKMIKKMRGLHSIHYEIPHEFIKAYAESKGDLKSVMVQPFYCLYTPDFYEAFPKLTENGKRLKYQTYKKDVEGYIALFPAASYNKAILESQLY